LYIVHYGLYRMRWLESNFLASGNRFWGRKVESYTTRWQWSSRNIPRGGASWSRLKVAYKSYRYLHNIIIMLRNDDFSMRMIMMMTIIITTTRRTFININMFLASRYQSLYARGPIIITITIILYIATYVHIVIEKCSRHLCNCKVQM